MSNIVIASPELLEAATITAGSEAGGMAASNLKLLPGRGRWRATALGSANLVVDLGAAFAINLIALLYTNATSAATWRIRGATSEANLTAAPGYDSGNIAHWPAQTGLGDWAWTHAFKFLTTAQNYQWWRIDITDAANPAGYYQASRLYIAAAWQPSINISFGASHGWVDPSEHGRSRAGQIAVREMNAYRAMNFQLRFQSEAQLFDNAFRLDRLRGRRRDVLVIRDPDTTTRGMDWCICGIVTDVSPIAHPAFDIYEKSYRLEELLP